MADLEFNIAKGRIVELYNRVKSNDPSNSVFLVILLQSSGLQSDALLKDHPTLSSILASNTEASFTNYVRKTLSDSDIDALPAPDYSNDYRTLDLPDQTWTSAGGASNNTLGKAIVCYDPDSTSGSDADVVPLTAHDYPVATDGGDMPLRFSASGWFRAT